MKKTLLKLWHLIWPWEYGLVIADLKAPWNEEYAAPGRRHVRTGEVQSYFWEWRKCAIPVRFYKGKTTDDYYNFKRENPLTRYE